jgi:hypothetical protein
VEENSMLDDGVAGGASSSIESLRKSSEEKPTQVEEKINRQLWEGLAGMPMGQG